MAAAVDRLARRVAGSRARCAGSGQRDAVALDAARTKAQWLGWLGITDDQLAHIEPLPQHRATTAKRGGFAHVAAARHGRLEPLPRSDEDDLRPASPASPSCTCSTRPTRRRSGRVEQRIDLATHPLHRVEQVGLTLEPNIFKQYFFERVDAGASGAQEAGRALHRDHRSRLEACSRWPRATVSATSSSACRASAAATRRCPTSAWSRPRSWALDVAEFLERDRGDGARPARRRSRPTDNPGVVLGAILGVGGNAVGRDKVTHRRLAGHRRPRRLARAALAESTGKEGKGSSRSTASRSARRRSTATTALFVYLRLDRRRTPAQDAAVAALERAGHPVVRIARGRPLRPRRGVLPLGDRHRGRRLHPRHQSVRSARRRGEQDRDAQADRRVRADRARCRAETPFFEATASSCSPTQTNAAALTRAAGRSRRSPAYLKAHLARLTAGDYFALLAYVEMNEAHERDAAGDPRHAVRDAEARRHVPRLRPALPALDGPGLQGRAEHRRLPADHLRRRGGSAGARTAVHLRRREGGAGARRLRGPAEARAPRPAGASGRGRRRRPQHAPEGGACSAAFMRRTAFTK